MFSKASSTYARLGTCPKTSRVSSSICNIYSDAYKLPKSRNCSIHAYNKEHQPGLWTRGGDFNGESHEKVYEVISGTGDMATASAYKVTMVDVT